MPTILHQAFYLNFLLARKFSAKAAVSVSIASIRQIIFKMKFVINASNIPYWLWSGLCCLCINLFAYVFLVNSFDFCMHFCRNFAHASLPSFFRYFYSFWKNISREYLVASKFLLDVPNFKKNVLIWKVCFPLRFA